MQDFQNPILTFPTHSIFRMYLQVNQRRRIVQKDGGASSNMVGLLKRTDLKECALPSHSTDQSHIITATFTIKSRARRCSVHGSIAF